MSFSIGILLVACGGGESGSVPAPPGDTTPVTTISEDSLPEVTPLPDRPVPDKSLPTIPGGEVPPPITGEAPQDLMAELLDDSADHFGVGESELTVIRDQQMEWSDGSLGCPEPGMMYTQAIVSGYWVVIGHDDQERDYRVGSGGGWRVCEGGLDLPSRDT